METMRVKFPYQSDRICENVFVADNLKENESVFALGNGYIGLRGNLEEGQAEGAETICGSFLNGVFESAPITYGEGAYGYAKNSETICNVADAKQLHLQADGEALRLGVSDVPKHARVLNLRSAVLERDFVWNTKNGARLSVHMERLVSLRHKELAAVSCRVKVLSGSVNLQILSPVTPAVMTAGDPDDPRTAAGKERALSVQSTKAEGNLICMTQRTKRSAFSVACAAMHTVSGAVCRAESTKTDDHAEWSAEASLLAGEELTVIKQIAYCSGKEAEEALAERACAVVLTAPTYSDLRAEQQEYMNAFWQNASISIDGDEATLQGLCFNMFHLLQSAGRDGKTNIAAKGLTGEGYEGHYFWDTEAYILPFFIHTEPEVARALLEYRCSILPKARERARVMGHSSGALFPWRTIDGEECSAYYPAGTAQYHINADIAYALQTYVDATGDFDFLAQSGAEVLAETARLWYDLGFFSAEKGGAFCINCVTGPDEYNVLVNNNVYTNLMAQFNLNAAVNALAWMCAQRTEEYKALCSKIALQPQEPENWKKAADAMYLCPAQNGIIPQDDAFLDRTPWPIASIPKENFPLLLHYHPLVIYRHQICKQADLVLAMLTRGECFSAEEKQKNFEFYDRVTTHDSSLSMAVFSILASEIRSREKAYDYFAATTRLDLDDMHGNTKDGLHMANMAGTWLCMAQGFGGMRCRGGRLSFDPYLPEQWRSYRFRVRFCGRTIEISVAPAQAVYTLVSGAPLTVSASGNEILLQLGEPCAIATR